MPKTIMVSDETYKNLDAIRQKVDGKNQVESFNVMLIRILAERKEVTP